MNPYSHSSEYRPVLCRLETRGVNGGITGEKEQRKRLRPNAGTEARLPYLLTNVAGDYDASRIQNETQRHSAALKSAGQSPIGLLPLDCGSRPLLWNASIWRQIVHSRHASFESFPNHWAVRRSAGWLSESSHQIPTAYNSRHPRFATPRLARENGVGRHIGSNQRE